MRLSQLHQRQEETLQSVVEGLQQSKAQAQALHRHILKTHTHTKEKFNIADQLYKHALLNSGLLTEQAGHTWIGSITGVQVDFMGV